MPLPPNDAPVDDLTEELAQTPEPELPAEEPAEGAEADPLQALLQAKGLTPEKAAELLAQTTDADAQEQARLEQMRRQDEFEQAFEDRFSREGGNRFAGLLQDRNFAQRALEHIQANHPTLLQGRQQEPDEELDPALAATRRVQAENAELKRQLSQLSQGQQEILRQQQVAAHQQAVANQFEGFLRQAPVAQKFEQELLEDLREAYLANPAKFRNPALDVRTFLKSKVEKYTRLAGGSTTMPAVRKTTPPRSASGHPGPAPQRKRLPDLSPGGIARAAYEYAMERSGTEE